MATPERYPEYDATPPNIYEEEKRQCLPAEQILIEEPYVLRYRTPPFTHLGLVDRDFPAFVTSKTDIGGGNYFLYFRTDQKCRWEDFDVSELGWAICNPAGMLSGEDGEFGYFISDNFVVPDSIDIY